MSFGLGRAHAELACQSLRPNRQGAKAALVISFAVTKLKMLGTIFVTCRIFCQIDKLQKQKSRREAEKEMVWHIFLQEMEHNVSLNCLPTNDTDIVEAL